MHNRMVLIKTAENNNTIGEGYTYDSKVMKDSEALHQVLCQNDPGDDYTIEFRRVVTSKLCEHGLESGYCANSKCPHFATQHEYAVSDEYSRWIGDGSRD